MELLTERYLSYPIKSSFSTTNLPDLLSSRSKSLSRLEDTKESIFPSVPFTCRNSKFSAPWRPSTYFSSNRLPYYEQSSSVRQLGPLINVHKNSSNLYELEGLKVPSIYSAARNALYTRYTPADWIYRNKSQVTDSEQARKKAEQIRASAARLGLETEDRTRQTQQEVGRLLGRRISDINFMKSELRNETDALLEEMNKLLESKRVCEKALAETENPLHLAQECLYNREKRQSTDLVHDNVEISLLKEIDTIKDCQDRIRNVINQATSQLSLCRAVQHELEKDQADKYQALQLDQLAQQLCNTSFNVALYENVEKIEKWMSVPEKWFEHTSANLKRSQSERASSRTLREVMEHCLGSTLSQIREYWSGSNAALSQRVQEIVDVKNRLHVQLEKVNQEIFDIEKSMEYLKKCIMDKQAPLKVARTRLDLRMRRPNIELCRDDPHGRLLREVGELEESINQLTKQSNETERVHQQLLRVKNQLEIDLSIKSNSLFIDREKCLGVRKSFPMNPSLIVPA